MSRRPFLALAATAAALSTVLSGCKYTEPLPAQLEAQLTLAPQAGAPREKAHLRLLADRIVDYLNLAGIDSKNARVRFDETRKAYYFEVFGRQPVARALLEQVAKGLNPLDRDRSWPANVEVAALAHLDTLLGGKERNFAVRASWKGAAIDAYVIQMPGAGFAMPGSAPKTALCMLSFVPEPAFPKLEGTFEQVYGKTQVDDNYALMRRHALPDQVFSAPYQVSFDEPELAKAFKEAPMAKDGKLMFQFAVLEDVNVLDFVGDKAAPMDFDGATQKKCVAELSAKYPALAGIIDRVSMLEQVKAFGPARIIPVPLPAK
jgi:hypothetical protein